MDLTVAVIGSGQCAPATDSAAERVGELLAAAGAVVVCGGLGGVMTAVCRGAHAGGGRTIGLLPGGDAGAANPWVDVALPTGMGQARNVLVVRAGRAVIAIGGGFGTLSEVAFACKLGVPVIGLDTWNLEERRHLVQPGSAGLTSADSPEDAVRLALIAAGRTDR